MTGFGLFFHPFVSQRAPFPRDDCDHLWHDLLAVTDADQSGRRLTRDDFWEALVMGRLPPVTYRDLESPLLFAAFTGLIRVAYAFEADAAGVMNLIEFKTSVRKLIDCTLSIHSELHGMDNVPGNAQTRAQRARELTKMLTPCLFRAVDKDKGGSISVYEFALASLMLLAAIQGAPSDAPLLAGFAFRLVDSDGDGKVSLSELTKWVDLAVQHEMISIETRSEGIGPFGWFGTRILTPKQLAKKWFNLANFERKAALGPQEFAVLAPRLKVHATLQSTVLPSTNPYQSLHAM